jgi:hypothetical protein
VIPKCHSLAGLLFRQFQQLVYVVLWHAAILHNVSKWQKVNTFSKKAVGWVSPVLDGARRTGKTACCDLAGDLAGDLAVFIKSVKKTTLIF